MNIYWDFANQKLLQSLASNQVLTEMTAVLRDVFPIVLAPVALNDSTQVYAPAALPTGQAIKFAAKQPEALDVDPLVSAMTWAWADNAYTADVDLGSGAMVSAMGTKSSLLLRAEFTLRDAAGHDHNSTQFDLTIVPDVNRVSDSVPNSLSPWFQHYQNANGAWCLRLVNKDGAPLVAWAPAGETP